MDAVMEFLRSFGSAGLFIHAMIDAFIFSDSLYRIGYMACTG